MDFKTIISTILATFLFQNKRANNTRADVSCKTQAAECAVCLSSLNGEMGTRVLPCMHEFHGVCVERWLAVPHFKNTCPICRFLVEEDCSKNGGGGGGGGGGDHELMLRRQQECFTEEMVIWFSSFHVAGF